METFTERIKTRKRLWWERPRWGQRTYRDALHRLSERRRFHSRHDPEEAWRCCQFWQRNLLNKWNGQEFAAKHGCPVPELYWRGGALSRPPFEVLPPHFVVRPVRGTGRRGVLVIARDRELLRDESATRRELRRRLSPLRRLRRPAPILIHEFVKSEEGSYRLPLEYKCHTFGEAVAVIEVTERNGIHADSFRCYTPAWEPLSDPIRMGLPIAPVRDPPRCLDQILGFAAALGVRFGTYARIDFFATDRGCVFNEFSSIPGGGTKYTPYYDELFGALWTEKFPDAS